MRLDRLDGATAAVLALAAALAASVFLSGCGASALERHTMAAGILHASAGEAAAIIEADARRAADAAIAPCLGADDTAPCEDELSRVMAPRRQAAAVQRVYASAVDSYVAALLVAASDDDPDWSDALTALARVMDVYSEVRGLAAEYGVELPQIGGVVTALLRGAQ